MLTKGVYFGKRPNKVEVHRIGEHGYTCRVDFPVNIQKIENDEGDAQYKADVYSLECGYTVASLRGSIRTMRAGSRWPRRSWCLCPLCRMPSMRSML